ncbi:MAG: GH32 C-terminal domain-containing protein [Thermogutta sp.]
MKRVQSGIVILLSLMSVLGGVTGGEEGELRPDILVDDFERDTYAPWTAEGEAFGSGTAQTIIPEVRGIPIVYRPQEGVLECLNSRVEGIPKAESFPIRILVDRTSMEVFAQRGRYVMSFCRAFDPATRKLRIWAEGGKAEVVSLEIYEMGTIWTR